LGRCEAGVEIQGVGAELGECNGCLDEPAMIAAQQGDPIGFIHSALGQGGGQPGGPVLDLRKGEHAPFVDDRCAGGITGEVQGIGPGHGDPIAADRAPHVQESVRPVGAQQPGPAEHCR